MWKNLFLGLTLLGSSTIAKAIIVNFEHVISGSELVQAGSVVGDFSVVLSYNLRDFTRLPNAEPPPFDPDGFPDRMRVDDDGNPVTPSGFVIWANDPLNPSAVDPNGDGVFAFYTPIPIYEDQFQAAINLSITSGPNAGVYNLLTNIDRIIINNNTPGTSPGTCRDGVTMETALGTFSFTQTGGCGGGSGALPGNLTNVFLESALAENMEELTPGLMGFEHNPGLSIESRMTLDDPLNVGLIFGGPIDTISELRAVIPEPHTISLIFLGLTALVGISWRRRYKLH